ncbi:hypothetical protein [Duganella flavida]|uniref:hypothetical protein n=1 Tax=Duganella flavida TaxID=2692175 RepID=UPI0019279547|nr:hypothetical protein [Duganella flavida]
MDKESIKGLLILLAVGAVLAVMAVVGTDDGWHKLGCVMRAITHGVALSNIRAICM